MMSRVIKFRAWFSKSGHEDMLFVGDAYGTSHQLDCCRYFQDGQPVELMQFTGLTDKNGVEIYEGDIIKDHNGVAKVDYSERFAAFRANYTDPYCKWFYDYNLKGERESIEVIGNIYQNPELLK